MQGMMQSLHALLLHAAAGSTHMLPRRACQSMLWGHVTHA